MTDQEVWYCSTPTCEKSVDIKYVGNKIVWVELVCNECKGRLEEEKEVFYNLSDTV
jgi:hypothetical protein